jgi:hypothetical protein
MTFNSRNLHRQVFSYPGVRDKIDVRLNYIGRRVQFLIGIPFPADVGSASPS